MAVGSRSTNTMTEGLRALLSNLSDMKVLPDADLQFLLTIEQQIVAKLREPYDRQLQGGGGPSGPPPGMGGGPGSMAGAMTQQGMPGQSAGPSQIPGVMQARQQPSPDELARVLGQGIGGGGPA
jgi:hypothetical protein